VSWKTVELGEVANVGAGNSAPQEENLFVNGTHNFYRTSDVGRIHYGVISDALDKLNDEGVKGLRLHPKGTILFPKSGASTFLNHRVMLEKEGYVSSHLATIKAIPEKANDKFLLYFLSTVDAKNLVQDSNYPSLKTSVIENVNIQLPPLTTQQKIVAKLDVIFAEIDKATAAAEANAKNAEVLFKSFLKETFNNSKKQSTKIKIENIANITSSKRIMKHEYVNEGIPFYRTKEVKELANKRAITTELFISKENYYEIKSRFGAPRKGEILITAIGTIGEIYVIDTDDEFYFKDGNVLWAKELKEVEPEFLKYVLMSFVNELNELSLGAAYSALPIHKLKNYEILIPNLEYQRIQIISIKNMEVYSNKLTIEYIQKKSLYSSLKQSILKKAFSGDLIKE
jgi:type I restriction enzyme S subunit